MAVTPRISRSRREKTSDSGDSYIQEQFPNAVVCKSDVWHVAIWKVERRSKSPSCLRLLPVADNVWKQHKQMSSKDIEVSPEFRTMVDSKPRAI